MLDAVGLTAEQQAVYLALLDTSPATPAQLRDRVPGARVRPAIAALESAGLISRLTGQPVRYQPAPPDMALEVLVRAHEQELQRVRVEMARLTERFRAGHGSTRPEEVVEVVTTRDATLQRWEQLQRSARHEVRSFDRPPYASDILVNEAERDGLAAGVAFRAVYAQAGLELPGRLRAMQRLIQDGEQARVTFDLPVKMFLADNAIGLIPLERPDRADSADSALVIHSSSLLDTLSALFELVWAAAVPVTFGVDDRRAEPDDDERRTLLGLLAAGLTDEAIGRQLGWHPRTVQRHVRRLMTELGAQTRFQAGLQAAHRGWL
ncbi:MAG TPA: helix-turn-helix domain-containing protein [Streptosporangiaceae bacterium]|jgi:sugar-specific transcriptional regulator TrmB|nr:helix-turn-helix domain-containing protein [Streptosporangiaceae bacterium]